jgi:hypothetical protein
MPDTPPQDFEGLIAAARACLADPAPPGVRDRTVLTVFNALAAMLAAHPGLDDAAEALRKFYRYETARLNGFRFGHFPKDPPAPDGRDRVWRPVAYDAARALDQADALREPPAAADTPPPKGKPGRPGYPPEAREYALELRRQNPHMTAAAIRQRCLDHFDADNMPAELEAFRRWLNRRPVRRAKRAN